MMFNPVVTFNTIHRKDGTWLAYCTMGLGAEGKTEREACSALQHAVMMHAKPTTTKSAPEKTLIKPKSTRKPARKSTRKITRRK